MQDYRGGVRSGRGLGIMPEIADGMSDDEMRELAHYFAVQTGH
jgi:cytochrome c553